MKSALNVTQTLYKKIATSTGVVKAVLSGDVYIDDRPENSILEDLVINCIALSSDQPQLCTANVNIHIQDVPITVQGKQQYLPNHLRIGAILSVLLPLIEQVSEGDYHYSVANQNLLRMRDTNESVYNIRINFLILNS